MFFEVKYFTVNKTIVSLRSFIEPKIYNFEYILENVSRKHLVYGKSRGEAEKYLFKWF